MDSSARPRSPGRTRGPASAPAPAHAHPPAPAPTSASVHEAPEAPLVRVPGLDYGLLDDLLGYALRRAQNALYLDFHRATAGADVSPQRFAALVLVGRNPGMRQGVLAEAMGLHRSGALRLTDWLTGRGWVERRDDPTDARRWGLHITSPGRRMLATLERQVQAHDQALLAALAKGGAPLKQALERLAEVADLSRQARLPTSGRSGTRPTRPTRPSSRPPRPPRTT